MPGEGRLPEAKPVDADLGGTPVWVVGVPLEDDTAWVVAMDDGRVEAFRFDGESRVVKPRNITPASLPPGTPPAVAVTGERIELLTMPGDSGSPVTHPIRSRTGLLGVSPDGTLLAEPGDIRALPILPDARLVESEDGRIAVLSTPTNRYIHGVLGDGLEAGSISVLKSGGDGYEVSGEIRPESGGVFEALAPLWFRPAPGEDELLAVTESTEEKSSRISIYNPGGRLVAAGPFLGEPRKWRHLLAAGPFGPSGETEIAAMRTPHIGGVIEFYGLDLASGTLDLAATDAGDYPSHTIYSRNLDAVRAGDLDGDGSWEVVISDTSRTGLQAVRRTRKGVEQAWSLPLGGTLATNLASATDSRGRIALAAGTREGKLRIWR